MIRLGADAVCWHARLAAGRVTFHDVLREAAAAGASYVQTMLDYVRDAPGGTAASAATASELGLALRTSGGAIGRDAFGGDAARAVAAIEGWAAEATALGSPDLMLYSGAYRPAIAGRPGAIAAELDFLATVLEGAAPRATELGVTLLLENASDFTADELSSLFARATSPSVGVFLDLTNPYNVWDDPLDAVRRLAPRAPVGHVKDFALESLWSADARHRRGFSVLFRYPGEGVADLEGIAGALVGALGERDFDLAVEGLDSDADVADQLPRLTASLAVMRSLLRAAGADVDGSAT